MTRVQESLFHNQQTREQFLVRNTADTAPMPSAKSTPADASGPFYPEAVAFVVDQPAFAVFCIELEKHTDAVVSACEALVKEKGGICGLWSGDQVGWALPTTDAETALATAQQIQSEVHANTGHKPTIGLASFPAHAFDARQTIENAPKALEHARFFDPGQVIVLDAVSLNISGDRFFEAGDIKAAIREYEDGLTMDPDNTNLHNSLGVCLGQQDKFAEARTHFETAASHDPDEPMPVYNLAMASLQMGNTDQAMQHLQAAEKLDADMFETVFQMGKLSLEKGAFQPALEYAQRAVELNAKSALVHRLLGEIYAEIDQPEEAIQSYKRAIKYNPADGPALSALGILFDQQGERGEIAALFCEQSLAVEPDNALFGLRLAGLYHQQGRLEDAKRVLKTALEQDYPGAKALMQSIENVLAPAAEDPSAADDRNLHRDPAKRAV